MTSRTRRPSRMHPMAVAAFVVAAMVASLRPAAAQVAGGDAHWQPWIGCWQPIADPATGVTVSTAQVCAVPGPAGAVDLFTIVDGRIAARETLVATGARQPNEQDGCAGWQQAQWSEDGRRLYRGSEHTCTGGVKRSTSGLFAMNASGEWIDVMSATSGETTGVRVLHYRPSFTINTALPADAQAALQQRMGLSNMARTAVAAPAGVPDIIDVSKHTTPGVTQAWLSELGQKFEISARDLMALSGAGVPGKVTDVVVALAYAHTFGIKRAPTAGATATGAVAAAGSSGLADCRVLPNYWPNPCGLFNPFLYGYMGPYGYSAYGYNYYGGAYGYRPYGTWYSAADPIVVVVGTSDGGGNQAGQTHGQVSRTRGYVEGRDSSTPPPSAPTPTASSQPSSSDSGGSGGGGASAPASSCGERTAHPR